MDIVVKMSNRLYAETLPLLKEESELAYMLFMVILSVKTSEKSWHKSNYFFSYLKALFFVHGADVILNLCTGKSPVAPISSNSTMLTVALMWWLVLFVPYDIFNKILYFELGDIMPVFLLISLLTTLRQIISVDDAVAASLKEYPGSFIAIFIGTLAGNGCLIVSIVFGDFARSISSYKMTTTAFVSAFLITVAKTLFAKTLPVHVVVSFCIVLMLTLEILEAFNVKVDLFTPVNDFVRRIVVTCDLFN